MKRSTRAVLLSGLVFPGLGHIFLKQYLRGSILVLIALATASVIIRFAKLSMRHSRVWMALSAETFPLMPAL